MGTISHGMLDSGNVQVSAPYYIAGKASITVPANGSRLATLVNFGRINPELPPGSAFANSPVRISRAAMFFTLISGATTTVAFELVRGTATVQDTTNGAQQVVIPKKTGGYPAVTAQEVSLYMSSAGTAVTGGNFAAAGAPFLIAGVGSGVAAFGFGEGTWTPPDLVPLSLEVGEAVACQVTSQGGAAVGILGLVFEFLRQ